MSSTVARMSGSLRHRGPDDEGVWSDGAAGIALGFRRLAIIDLTPAGHQPMASSDGRWVLMLNGEIYNFLELRAELEASGSRFRGRSDTEVILEGLVRWGLERTVENLNGMFAIALWDRRDRVLHLARDRFGEKPLYYGWMGNVFLFGSEIKALRAHPAFRAEVDRNALALYSRFGYVPAPHSIFQGVSKLPAAARIEVTAASREPRMVRYWSPLEVALAGLGNRFAGSLAEGIEEIDARLRRAVGLRMVSDVPLGAFLSGGIDSSLVVAQMQAQSAVPVRTFSIGFQEPEYDEAPEAAAVARHLGTDHTEAYVSPADTIAVIPRLPAMYDEPLADPSQIPTYLVSAIARRNVTVSLSGDGGDEIFGGYGRYALGRALWRGMSWAPHPARTAAAAALRGVATAGGGRVAASLRVRRASDKLQKLAEILSTEKQEGLYLRLMSLEKSPESLVPSSVEPPTPMTSWQRLSPMRVLDRMMYLDTVSYLPEDILVKVDRASMAVSLESRAPFLDPELFAFAWRLPLDWKFRGGKGKWILRKVLQKYVPVELFDRPKMGFGVPIDSWLRGPLRDWAENLLSEDRLRREGFFEPARVRSKWNEHASGARNWHFFLWDILMFQAWLDDQSKQGAALAQRTA
ncbi:MAG: asparagine synthase (glutamine-hydrolyzing) [Acidobacteriota bacterium]|nr:asparagine synthase (glutamine-hydrolyzing) [Acidobacteriota bacterium]